MSGAWTSGPPEPTRFDLGDPLPQGHVTLEASAGTGKTHSIVGLAVRYLAEGHCTAAGLLVVTFARSATRELRERLLEGLAWAVALLEDHLDGRLVTDSDEPDGLRRALCGGTDQAVLHARHDRLARALADIDQATVTTIHGFAGLMLQLIGDQIDASRLIEDDTELLQQIAGDLRLRVLADSPDDVASLPWVDSGPELAQKGTRYGPDAVMPPPSLGSWETAPSWMAVEAGREYRRRSDQMLVHTHDDVLRTLRDALQDTATAARLGQRFRVALIDEFQDTDPVQWDIVSLLFPPPPTLQVVGASPPSGSAGSPAVVMVGDPKQAIYAFRGADVHAYLEARGARASYTLPTNRRSDRPLVDAVLDLFTDQNLGAGIDVPRVEAHVDRSRLTGTAMAPVDVRLVPDDAAVRRTKDGGMSTSSLREFVARDVAVQAAALLGAGVQIADAPTEEDAAPREGRALVPHDLAILVRTRRQASIVQRQLTTVGVPSILNGVGNVLRTRAARDWAHLLRALAEPSRSSPARLAALTDLIGWTPHSISLATSAEWDRLHINLHDLRAVLEGDVVAAVLRHVEAATQLSVRLVSEADGLRRLTDLRHVAELLHQVASDELVGIPGLVAWLEAGLAVAGEADSPVPPESIASRLEREDGAVQIMTVHGAKGLEFGVVFAPYLWDTGGRATAAFDVHDPRLGHRVLYAGRSKKAPEYQHYKDLHTQQAEEEERRLAYVAATRAKHHLRVWFAPGRRVADSPLGTLLSRGGERVTSTADAEASLRLLQEERSSAIAISHVSDEAPVPDVHVERRSQVAPVLARFDRSIDGQWRRTSYSRISGQASDPATAGMAGQQDTSAGGLAGPVDGTPPEDRPPRAPALHELGGEPDLSAGGEPDLSAGESDGPGGEPDPALEAPVPLRRLRGGADVGTVIHSVLENLDFRDADVRGASLDARIAGELSRQITRQALDLGDAEEVDVAGGLAAALRTPLGPATDPTLGSVCLTDLTRADRLDEMAFELPVDSQRRPTSRLEAEQVLVGDIADLMEQTLPASDPLVSYPAQLRSELADIPIRGYLAGFVDLVARIPGSNSYLVADYKTNRLGPPGAEDLTFADYTGTSMALAMAHHHYPLQALLYQVALHRYLRWRLPDYDPARHLGGSAYLFLRGMGGPETPAAAGMRCGVFLWQPPPTLIVGVDRLFGQGRSRTDLDSGGDRD